MAAKIFNLIEVRTFNSFLNLFLERITCCVEETKNENHSFVTLDNGLYEVKLVYDFSVRTAGV